MKNRIIIAILALTSVACSVQTNNNQVKTTPSSTSENIASTTEEVYTTPTPKPTRTPKPIFIEKCIDLDYSQIEKKLSDPIDIVVSKDGSFVYVINSEYDYLTKKGIQIYKTYEKEGINYSERYATQKLYKVTNTKNVSIVELHPKDSEEVLVSCNIQEIERNNEHDLLIRAINKIVLVKNNDYNILIKNLVKYSIYSPPAVVDRYGSPLPPFEYRGPFSMFVENDSIYFSYYLDISHSELGEIKQGIVNRYDISTNKISEVYLETPNKSHDSFTKTPYSRFIKNTDQYYKSSSIYEGKPFFGIEDLIVVEEEKSKVGKILQIRKNSKGEVFGLDIEKNIIWKILPKEQKVIQFVGSGKSGYKDGKGIETEFNGLRELDIDVFDNLYVTDSKNNAIRRITSEGIVTTFYQG